MLKTDEEVRRKCAHTVVWFGVDHIRQYVLCATNEEINFSGVTFPNVLPELVTDYVGSRVPG